MIKKVIFFIGIFIIFAIVAYIAINFISFKINEPPENWKKIDLKEYGHIFVPEDWNFSVDDGFMYIYSEENGERKNILIQYYAILDSTSNITNKYFSEEKNKYFSEVEDYTVLENIYMSSASAYIRKVVLHYKYGLSPEMFQLEFVGRDGSIYFICVDDSVPEDLLKKIAYYYNEDDTFSLRRGE